MSADAAVRRDLRSGAYDCPLTDSSAGRHARRGVDDGDELDANPGRLMDEPNTVRASKCTDPAMRRGQCGKLVDPIDGKTVDTLSTSLPVEILDESLHPEAGGLGDEVEHLRREMMRAEHDQRLNRDVHVERRFYHLVR